MDAQACPYCANLLSDKSIFCGKCGHQVRCKGCNDLLEPDAPFCTTCGMPVGESGAATLATQNRTPFNTPIMNTFEYEKNRAGESVRAQFTDATAESLGAVFGSMFMGGVVSRTSQAKQRDEIEKHSDTDDFALDGTAREVTSARPIAVAAAAIPATTPSSVRERLEQVFRRDGDKVQLDEPRLRASSKLDYIHRLVLLYLLYTREVEEREDVPRSDIYALLKDADLYDTNVSRSVNTTPGIEAAATTIRLRLPGRERSREILDEVFDPNAADTWTLEGVTKSRRSRSSAPESDDEHATKPPRRQGRLPSGTVATWLSAWKGLNLPVKGHAVLQNRTVADKGIFGLWAIRLAMGDAAKEVSRRNLSKFLWEAFEISADDKTLERSLKKQTDKVRNTRGSTFQILPPGQDYAIQMAGLDQATITSPGASP